MIEISTDKKKIDIKIVHNYLCNESYWAKDRSLETVQRSIENSLCFGVYFENRQVGFARVITDYAVFAWLLDVFILPEYQGKGSGKKLMDAIMNHNDLQGLRRWGLGTDDAHGLYTLFGFARLQKPENMMEIVIKNNLRYGDSPLLQVPIDNPSSLLLKLETSKTWTNLKQISTFTGFEQMNRQIKITR